MAAGAAAGPNGPRPSLLSMAGGRVRAGFVRQFTAPSFSLFGIGGWVLGALSSFFALAHQFGYWRVLVGGMVGASVGVLLRYWANLLVRLDKLKKDLTELRARYDSALAELGKWRKQLADDRAVYERALADIADRAFRSPIVNQHVRIHFIMGRSKAEDQVRERYITCAPDPDRSLLWYEVRMNGSGDEVPNLQSFRDLKGVSGYEVIEGDNEDAGLQLLPIARHSSRGGHRALALFSQRIDHKPRTWGWSYRWPIFEPLRAKRQDSFGYDVYEGVEYDLLEIHIVFPPFARKPRVYFDERNSSHGPSPTEKPRSTLLPRNSGEEWDFEIKLFRPRPGFYSWRVTVEGFDESDSELAAN